MAYKIKSEKKPVFIREPYGLPQELQEKDKFAVNKPQFDSEYDKQAYNFLKDTNTKFSIKYLKHDKYFPDDKESRDIYHFTIVKDGKTYSGTFGQSIAGTEKEEVPSAYSVLSSLSADRFEGSFEDFCREYGYDSDSRKAEQIYKAVVKENEGMKKLYSEEELNKLGEIQ